MMLYLKMTTRKKKEGREGGMNREKEGGMEGGREGGVVERREGQREEGRKMTQLFLAWRLVIDHSEQVCKLPKILITDEGSLDLKWLCGIEPLPSLTY